MPSDHLRDVLVQQIAPRADEVVRRAAHRARHEIPSYAVVPEEEIAAGIARDLGLAIAAMVEDRPLTDEDRRSMGVIGDTRARQGLPLEAMLRVYRFTVEEVFGVLWQASDQGALSHQDVLSLMQEVFRYSDAVTEVAVSSYRERELELAVAGSEERTALVHRLLLTTASTPEEAISRAGLDPQALHVPFRARGRDEDATRHLLRDLQAPRVLPGGLAASHGGDVIGLAPKPPRLPATDGTIVGLGPAMSLATVSRSFAVATRVVETATAFERVGTFELADLALEAVARAETELADQLVANHVTPADPGSPAGRELLETVAAFLDHDGAVEPAAEHLHVHPNTVRNRLRRYEQLTTTSLGDLDARVRVRLALLRTRLG